MQSIICENCKHEFWVEHTQNKAFCTHCGTKCILPNDDNRKLQATIDLLLTHQDPVHIHQKLLRLNQENPNNLLVKQAILLQGRLHERNAKKVDFGVIHCYLLNIFLEPEIFSKAQIEKNCNELMQGENLLACLALAPNKNRFLSQYYEQISKRFIELFLLGSSKYMRSFFGFSLSKNPAKTLAQPIAYMIQNILHCTALGKYSPVLAKALYVSFIELFKESQHLHALLQKEIAILQAENEPIYAE